MPVQATDPTPSPELLELLGMFSVLEELGVNVDQQIDSRTKPESAQTIERPLASDGPVSEPES